MKNKIIMLLLILALIGSVSFMYIENENNKVIIDTPNEIVVKDEEKVEVSVEGTKILFAPDIDLDAARRENNNYEIVGRLELPDLFNILVSQTTNNNFYLSHSVKKEWDIKGSEFLDYRTGPLSKQINVYGHNSRDPNLKVPFLRLESFLDKDYFDSHPYIVFQHDNGKNFYKIMAIKEVVTDLEHMTVNLSGSEFKTHLDKIRSDSMYTRDVPYNENSEIIILQTCSHHLDNAYYIFTGIRISPDEVK